MDKMEQNTQAPPPSYQQAGQQVPGQTYYQPPPVAQGNYAAPPPVVNSNNSRMGRKFTQFYAPPQNKSLGMKRRVSSIICCCILIGLIVGLAAGLTSVSRTHCNCQTNADCTSIYGTGTYCYAGCQCARY